MTTDTELRALAERHRDRLQVHLKWLRGFPRTAIGQQTADAIEYYLALATEKAELERQRDLNLGTLAQRAFDVQGLEEDIAKLRRVVERAISASVTVTNDVAREKLMEAIAALPMRLRHASRQSGG